MIRPRNLAMYVIAALLTVAFAFFLGSRVGDAINARRVEKFKKHRSESNRAILAKMDNIQPGSRVENYYFEKLDGDLVGLRELIEGRTLMVFMEPDCPGCLVQIERVQRLLKETRDPNCFIFISSGSPFELIALREEYDVKSPILYDHRGAFSSRFKVFTYPFNLLVNERLEIEQVVPGQLTEDEIMEMIHSEGNLTAR